MPSKIVCIIRHIVHRLAHGLCLDRARHILDIVGEPAEGRISINRHGSHDLVETILITQALDNLQDVSACPFEGSENLAPARNVVALIDNSMKGFRRKLFFRNSRSSGNLGSTEDGFAARSYSCQR